MFSVMDFVIILTHYPIITTYYRCFIEYKKDFSLFSLQFPKNAVKVTENGFNGMLNLR
jgi:hypothetical protein